MGRWVVKGKRHFIRLMQYPDLKKMLVARTSAVAVDVKKSQQNWEMGECTVSKGGEGRGNSKVPAWTVGRIVLAFMEMRSLGRRRGTGLRKKQRPPLTQ